MFVVKFPGKLFLANVTKFFHCSAGHYSKEICLFRLTSPFFLCSFTCYTQINTSCRFASTQKKLHIITLKNMIKFFLKFSYIKLHATFFNKSTINTFQVYLHLKIGKIYFLKSFVYFFNMKQLYCVEFLSSSQTR